MWEVVFYAVLSAIVFVIFAAVRVRQHEENCRAVRIVRSLDNLMQSETSILTFSCSVEGYETVCVADTWTGWAEQCFYNTTIEGALEDAIRSRDECRGK